MVVAAAGGGSLPRRAGKVSPSLASVSSRCGGLVRRAPGRWWWVCSAEEEEGGGGSWEAEFGVGGGIGCRSTRLESVLRLACEFNH